MFQDHQDESERMPLAMGTERGEWVPLYEPCRIGMKVRGKGPLKGRGATVHAQRVLEQKEGRALSGLKGDSREYCLHKCDTKGCVQEEHLYVGDNSANMKDAALRGTLNLKDVESRRASGAARRIAAGRPRPGDHELVERRAQRARRRASGSTR